jgi:putative DNA primase/helicase
MKTVYTYKDAAGDVIGTITRLDRADGTKDFRASPGFPDPRPLYGLDILAARPNDPVLVVEGEKAAEAARNIFPDYVGTTSPFGAHAAPKTDLSPLLGRNVTIWPDNDPAGVDYALDILASIPHAKIVPLPPNVFRDG